MINYQTINSDLLEGSCGFSYQEPHKVFTRLYGTYRYKFLFESKDISSIYGRLSLIGIDPVLRVTGKKDTFCIKVLNERGQLYLKQFNDKDFKICDRFKISEKSVSGTVYNHTALFEETERSKRKNIAQIMRIILKKFETKQKSFLGLYGALSYDFIRLFEDIGQSTPENDVDDFTLFLYDTFIFFDHLKQTNKIIAYRKNTQEAEKDINLIQAKMNREGTSNISYRISDSCFELNQKQYQNLVKLAKKYAAEGELFEVVFSNVLKACFNGDPFALYLKYRDSNPSPYLFYFDFGKEQLVGASPEMMVRCENKIVSLRPISGTVQRGKDPIEDHENMLSLLSDPKERAELDMLIDLGRNDLSRVCEPEIQITDYRFVEKYSRVMHTVAHLSGKLRKSYTALDALIACLNAGTLTGAPKVAAMKTIEKHEKERRGYYGGTIGYFTFSGDMDTGIIIRTAHIRGRQLRFQVGATLLYDSVPEKEYTETLNKASAFLNCSSNYVFQKFSNKFNI
ncbi:anthranilate synthase component I family protein [Candidatus Peregrinibacteria bacterium]|nr:anthranilate synthase component I family protein [Candidatus Peregrinibacteria bacterium]